MLPSMACCPLSVVTVESSEVTETEVQQVTVKLSVMRERERESYPSPVTALQLALKLLSSAEFS